MKIKSVGIVVGTPQYLVDYLPLINDIKFDWLVVDEIHMIGKESCKEMEVIIKAYSDIPIMALSATIGNAEVLKEWFIKTGHNNEKHNMQIIKCDKRFFNLQKFYYDDNKEKINTISPINNLKVFSLKYLSAQKKKIAFLIISWRYKKQIIKKINKFFQINNSIKIIRTFPNA